jgi:glycosyltransferase involved in cell wall biosynthesis
MRCGVGDYTRSLAEALVAADDVEVGVLTSTAVVAPAQPMVQVLPVMPHWKIGQAAQVFRALRTWRPDLVHIQYPTQGYDAQLLVNLIPLMSASLGARVVQTWHEPLRLRDLLLRTLVRTEVIVVRPNFRELVRPEVRWALRCRPLHHIRGASALPSVSLCPHESRMLREHYLKGQQRLVVYFGFIYPHKGVDKLFEIADPQTDHLVIAGEFGQDVSYRARVLELAQGRWDGKVTFAGFLGEMDAARLLAVSDAVVLPFRTGGGVWNSSIHAAAANGAYIVTTSAERVGFDHSENIAYVPVGDVNAMRAALAESSAPRREVAFSKSTGWGEIVTRHMCIYRSKIA